MISRFCLTLSIAFLPTLASAQSVYSSEYSSLEPASCKEVPSLGNSEEDGPNDSFQRKCPGKDGYSVEEVGGDMRSWLVLRKGQQVIDLYGTGAEDMVFPNLNPGKLEWRYRSAAGAKVLVGLIFRMAGQERKAHEAGNYKTKTSMLYALRFSPQGACLLGKAKTNEEARVLTDRESAACTPIPAKAAP